MRPAAVTLALRLHRGGIVACAILGALLTMSQAAAFSAVAGITPEERLVFGRQVQLFAIQFSYFLALPIRPDTVGGYTLWRGFGMLPWVFGFWALLSATNATRVDEERGLVEQWLVAGTSRRGYIAARLLGFLLAGTLVTVAIGLATAAGAAVAGEPLGFGSVAGQCVAVFGLAVCLYALVLLLSQFAATRRGAAGLAAGALLALFFLNSLSRGNEALRPYRWISPFAYLDRTTILAPGGTFDGAATAALFGAGAALGAIAIAAFTRRDLGAPLFRYPLVTRPPSFTPATNPLLRIPVLAPLYEQRVVLLWWLLGVGLMSLFFLSAVNTVVDMLSRLPTMQGYLRLIGGDNPHQALLGYSWFGTLELVVIAYAITHVARWVSDDAEGRLEMILAAPVPRWRVVIERALTLALGCTAIAGVGALVAGIGAPWQAIRLDAGGLALAGALLLPLALSFGAAGAAVAGRFPRATVAVLSVLAMLSYFIVQLGPLFRWPGWVMNLSPLQLYGFPLVRGVFWEGLWALLAIVFAGFGAGIITMQRRDVGR